jgi:hypothetical protein
MRDDANNDNHWHRNPALRTDREREEFERNKEEFLVKGAEEMLESMTPEQRHFFLSNILATEPQVKSDANAMEALYSIDYDYQPVSPETFFTSNDYVGHLARDIFPRWWPELLRINEPQNKIHEVILTGAIGIGKTMIAMLCLAYKLYRTSCLKDPARYYGLATRSDIYFALYAITLQTVEETGFQALTGQIMAPSPYFSERFRPESSRTSDITFRKGIKLITGSSQLHSIGRNLFTLCVDEINFFRTNTKQSEEKDKANKLATDVARRIESRFKQASGEVPGLILFISSKRSSSDFIERRVEKVRNRDGVVIVDGPRWEFNTKVSLSGLNFRVMRGTGSIDPMLLEEVVFDDRGRMTGEIRPLVNIDEVEGPIIEVPAEFYENFREDLVGSLCDIAGVAASVTNPLFPIKRIVHDAVDDALPRFFTADEYPLHVGSMTQLEELASRNSMATLLNSIYRPARHPNAPRYIHVDLSLRNDRTGIVMVHPAAHHTVIDKVVASSSNISSAVDYTAIEKSVEVDFALAIRSGPNKEQIDIQKVRNFISYLRSLGFNIATVTFDSYNSADAIQRLNEQGFTAAVLSVDKTDAQYRVLRQAIAERRLRMPRNQLLIKELLTLEHNIVDAKVDHQPDGSKDVADALCGAVFSCLTDEKTPKYKPERDIAPSDGLEDYAAILRALNSR